MPKQEEVAEQPNPPESETKPAHKIGIIIRDYHREVRD
jgi:hypothetical protein